MLRQVRSGYVTFG